VQHHPDPVNIGETLIWHRPSGKTETGTVGLGQGGSPVFINADIAGYVPINDETPGWFERPA
jgi:hypothetical protein